MSFQSIIGQETAKQILQNSLRADKLSHAYLFHGPAGTGKQAMAFALAKAIYCTQSQDDACDLCLECRKMENHNHPDLMMIEPSGSTIKIEQIRTLQKEFSFRAISSQRKIYIINQAHLMTIQAANSLLKFLEEPQSHIVAILITDNGQAILPTIVSRAQGVPFTPMSVAQMIPILVGEGYAPELVRPAVHMTSGLEAARNLIQNNAFAEMRSTVIQLAKDILVNSSAALLTANQRIVKANFIDHIQALMDLLVLWFKDMIHIQCSRKQSIIFIDQEDWLTRHAFTRDLSYWIHCMDQAATSHKRVRAHVNPQLVLEQFIINTEGRRHSIV